MIRTLFFLFVTLLFSNCKPQQYFERPDDFTNNPYYRGTTYFEDTTTCPNPKIVEQLDGRLIASRYLKLVHNNWSNDLNAFIQLINRKTTGIGANHVEDDFLDLRLEDISTKELKKSALGLQEWQYTSYYELVITPSSVVLKSTTEEGASYGLATLLCLLENKVLLSTKVIDWADLKQRYLQVLLKDMQPEIVIKVIESAWRQKYNGLLFTVYNGVKFKALGKHSRISAMSVVDFQKLVDYAESLKMVVVPHFDFLTHQDEGFFQQKVDSSLLYNRRTLNPENEKVYDIIFQLIDEVDSLISPAAIHIGHDEVMGFRSDQVEEYGPILPAHLFLKNIRRIRTYLESKNIETQIWGDMLLHKSDFPDMHPSSINAVDEYRYLSDSLSKDIVITDWHYLHYKWRIKQGPISFPSTKMFADRGHKVFGATYIYPNVMKLFPKYMAKENHPNFQGMIATTWHQLLNGTFFKHNDEMQAYYKIMSKSAEYYWNASTK